jgi:hypothetical protein
MLRGLSAAQPGTGADLLSDRDGAQLAGWRVSDSSPSRERVGHADVGRITGQVMTVRGR